MIANFFQSLSDQSVDYLLISGQATILYGAATFSEDIDLWISPTAENCERFTSVLRSCQARFYKLTPQLRLERLRSGHGFHFKTAGGVIYVCARDCPLDGNGMESGPHHWSKTSPRIEKDSAP